MANTVRSRKEKGKKLQKEVAGRISKLLDIPVEKDGDIESRAMSQSGVDVILRGDAKKRFPFAIEAKNQERFSLAEWIKQAKTNQGDFKYWLLCIGKNYWKPVVVMDMDTFFELYEKVLERKK